MIFYGKTKLSFSISFGMKFFSFNDCKEVFLSEDNATYKKEKKIISMMRRIGYCLRKKIESDKKICLALE